MKNMKRKPVELYVPKGNYSKQQEAQILKKKKKKNVEDCDIPRADKMNT